MERIPERAQRTLALPSKSNAIDADQIPYFARRTGRDRRQRSARIRLQISRRKVSRTGQVLVMHPPSVVSDLGTTTDGQRVFELCAITAGIYSTREG